MIWRHGLFPTIVAGAFLYLLYSMANVYSMKLDALGLKLDAHQAAMDRAEADRAITNRAQAQRLKGICYGVTEDGSRARALCDVE
jgi:hypothetical protein